MPTDQNQDRDDKSGLCDVCGMAVENLTIHLLNDHPEVAYAEVESEVCSQLEL